MVTMDIDIILLRHNLIVITIFISDQNHKSLYKLDLITFIKHTNIHNFKRTGTLNL